MKFIYTTQNDQFRKDAVYENPKYFEKLPPQGLTQYEEVIVVGNWPLIEAALDAAEIPWRGADKGDDLGGDVETRDNTGRVAGAPTGSNQTNRQKKGAVVNDIVQAGPLKEGEGDGSGASIAKTGDGLETVAREAGAGLSGAHMKGSEQVVEIPADWEQLQWPELRALASQFSDETIIKKDRALEVMATEVKRRAKG